MTGKFQKRQIKQQVRQIQADFNAMKARIDAFEELESVLLKLDADDAELAIVNGLRTNSLAVYAQMLKNALGIPVGVPVRREATEPAPVTAPSDSADQAG